MRRSLESRVTPTGSDAASIRLVVPERLVLDEIARERLVRALLAAPGDVGAVGGEISALDPGASYRVAAEWQSLDGGPPRPAAGRSVRGAVAVRTDTRYRVDGDAVTVEAGRVLIDPGAPVHDPRGSGTLAPASATGRSPFPRRPIVCFIGLEADAEREDWARRLVNRLVRRDIEARLLTPTGVPEGFHLTRPALAGAASIAALGPDVIVALDPGAARMAPDWCTRRETTLIDYDPENTESTQLVSWELTRAKGRLRARIGRRVDAPTLAGLVLRLCAGPQPEAPRDRPARIVPPPAPIPPARRTVVLAADPACARALGLVDALGAAGYDSDLAIAGEHDPEAVRTADLVVLTGLPAEREVSRLVSARATDGRPTVCDLDATALSIIDAEGPAELSGAAERLARACGLVTAVPGAVVRAAERLDLPTLGLPTMPTRHRIAELIAARAADSTKLRVIGWHPGPEDESTSEAVGDALVALLDAHPALRIEMGGRVPGVLAGHARIAVMSAPTADTIAAWRMHLWTPLLLDGAPIDDQTAVREAALVGVPTVCSIEARPAIAGFTADVLTATDAADPDDWTAVLGHLLAHPEARLPIARRVARRGEAVYGPLWWKLIANRLVGWATGPGAP